MSDEIKISELKDSIDTACRVSNENGAFSLVVIAAFSKSIGFVVQIEDATYKNKSFWVSATLRSICEDLIVLSYIDKNFKSKADEIIKLQLSIDTKKSLEAQEKLFSKYRPQQPIVRPKSNDSKPEEKLKNIFQEYVSVKKGCQPSIWEMAKDQDLDILYNYLYHATSRFVHFSPNTLLKMAWFDPDINRSHCDPNSFDNYYYQFAKFYSAHMLSSLVNRFSSIIILDDCLTQAVDRNLKNVNSNPRWPELITFEELNVGSPWDQDDFARKNSFYDIFIEDPGIIFKPKC